MVCSPRPFLLALLGHLLMWTIPGKRVSSLMNFPQSTSCPLCFRPIGKPTTHSFWCWTHPSHQWSWKSRTPKPASNLCGSSASRATHSASFSVAVLEGSHNSLASIINDLWETPSSPQQHKLLQKVNHRLPVQNYSLPEAQLLSHDATVAAMELYMHLHLIRHKQASPVQRPWPQFQGQGLYDWPSCGFPPGLSFQHPRDAETLAEHWMEYKLGKIFTFTLTDCRVPEPPFQPRHHGGRASTIFSSIYDNHSRTSIHVSPYS